VGCVRHWSRYLGEAAENEKVSELEIRGTLARNVPEALAEMQDLARATRCQGNFLYHASFNPHPQDRRLTLEETFKGIDTLEKSLGFEGHQRIVYEHVKQGRQHLHILWNRAHPEKLTIRDIGGDWFTCRAVSNRLEQEFGLIPTKPKRQRNDPRPLQQWELQRREKCGLDPNAVKAELSKLWQATKTGQEFKQSMETRGYILARGDRRDFVVIDKAGHDHSLARRLNGVSTARLRERMMDIDRAVLPSVAEARIIARHNREAVPKSKDQAHQIVKGQCNTAQDRGSGNIDIVSEQRAAMVRLQRNAAYSTAPQPPASTHETGSGQTGVSKPSQPALRGGGQTSRLSVSRAKVPRITAMPVVRPEPVKEPSELPREPCGVPNPEASEPQDHIAPDDQDAIMLDLALDELFRRTRLRLADAPQYEKGAALASTRAAIVNERSRAARYLIEQFKLGRALAQAGTNRPTGRVSPPLPWGSQVALK